MGKNATSITELQCSAVAAPIIVQWGWYRVLQRNVYPYFVLPSVAYRWMSNGTWADKRAQASAVPGCHHDHVQSHRTVCRGMIGSMATKRDVDFGSRECCQLRELVAPPGRTNLHRCRFLGFWFFFFYIQNYVFNSEYILGILTAIRSDHTLLTKPFPPRLTHYFSSDFRRQF